MVIYTKYAGKQNNSMLFFYKICIPRQIFFQFLPDSQKKW